MILKAERFEARAMKAAPESLVEGWPSDYWLAWRHPTKQIQLKRAMTAPMEHLFRWMAGGAPEMPGFIFYGPAGFGKTATMLTLMDMAARRGFTARFTTAEALSAQRESTVYNFKEGKTYESLLKEILAPDILGIDDIVTRTYSPNVRAMLFDAVRERKSRKKLTAMTTNANLDATTADGKAGIKAFSDCLDFRVLSTYTGWAFNASKWGTETEPAASLRGR